MLNQLFFIIYCSGQAL